MSTILTRSLSATCICALLTVLAVSTVNAGPLIKWIDENGQVHYGDAMPASQADLERKVLSGQGVTMETIERAKTPEEQAEAHRQAELLAEEKRKLDEQAAKDHVLLATFSSEDDMIMTRDGKIMAINTIIRLTKDRIRRITQQLRDLAHDAAEIERSGEEVPDELHEQIANGKAEIQRHEQYISVQEHEQEALQHKFASDIERFRYLRGRMAGVSTQKAATVQEKPAGNPSRPPVSNTGSGSPLPHR